MAGLVSHFSFAPCSVQLRGPAPLGLIARPRGSIPASPAANHASKQNERIPGTGREGTLLSDQCAAVCHP